MVTPEVRGIRRPRLLAAGLIIAVTITSLAVYPFLPSAVRQWLFVGVSWMVVLPVAAALRGIPAGLRSPWRLLVAAMTLAAITTTVLAVPAARVPVVDVALNVASAVASLMVLSAAIAVVMRRGRNDIGGLIDAALAAMVVGGLLWNMVLLPQLQSIGRDGAEAASLAVVVMVLAGTAGALLRLIDTDPAANPVLRLLLVAVACNLAGSVLTGGWPDSGAGTAGAMLFLVTYATLGLASIDSAGLVELARIGAERPDRLGPGRLTFMAFTLLAAPLVAGVRLIQHRPVDGVFLIFFSVLMVGLVIVRIGLLGKQLDRSQAALRHLAQHDPLTGVLNRRGFSELLSAELRGQHGFVLVFCDLDAFKRVNDEYGHTVGDRLLTDVAERLRSSLRQNDIVGRMGGDEFVMLVRDAGPADVAGVRRRITEALRPPFCHASGEVTISASIGSIVTSPVDLPELTAEDLIEQADAAMYAEKAPTPDRPRRASA
ncbi:diguanylate cyclase (GGDEF)-like protein [Allocatelliglobosispora scoriae]|uniref:Diguanylate cyclase (GGDEF)-like protein n=1 Tax=Allocatelliglobosispora scoriae TaxID=643052 RepID=A0A841C5D4_9ACTN|nr:GGDEF domain-containing protein [Allocatelliglobosispora scoriae]MBB5874021.1 diguanylate cyclase (GGDEF)-like protein [Allocatelliglobosispora scoriae]